MTKSGKCGFPVSISGSRRLAELSCLYQKSNWARMYLHEKNKKNRTDSFKNRAPNYGFVKVEFCAISCARLVGPYPQRADSGGDIPPRPPRSWTFETNARDVWLYINIITYVYIIVYRHYCTLFIEYKYGYYYYY